MTIVNDGFGLCSKTSWDEKRVSMSNPNVNPVVALYHNGNFGAASNPNCGKMFLSTIVKVSLEGYYSKVNEGITSNGGLSVSPLESFKGSGLGYF